MSPPVNTSGLGTSPLAVCVPSLIASDLATTWRPGETRGGPGRRRRSSNARACLARRFLRRNPTTRARHGDRVLARRRGINGPTAQTGISCGRTPTPSRSCRHRMAARQRRHRPATTSILPHPRRPDTGTTHSRHFTADWPDRADLKPPRLSRGVCRSTSIYEDVSGLARDGITLAQRNGILTVSWTRNRTTRSSR